MILPFFARIYFVQGTRVGRREGELGDRGDFPLNLGFLPGVRNPRALGTREMSETKSQGSESWALQSCPTLCDPIDGSPPGSSVPGILQARTLESVAISFSNA